MATIVEAIKTVLEEYPDGLTSAEIYEKIIEKDLYIFNAISPRAIVNGMIRRHCYGLDFPTANPHKFFKIISSQHGKSKYALYNENDEKDSVKLTSFSIKEKLPEEKILDNYNEHIISVKSQLMNAIINSSPAFFERYVVDLLLKMGYGRNSSSGIVTRITHDGGVDGIIKEDELGLDQIYIQAKRYAIGNNVGTPVLQQFAGVMSNRGIKKGVFFTTSDFVKSVKNEFARPFDGKIIRLINGDELMEFAIEHEVGVKSAPKVYKTFAIDENYFSQ